MLPILDKSSLSKFLITCFVALALPGGPALARDGHLNALRKCSSSLELSWISGWQNGTQDTDLLQLLFLAEDLSDQQQIAIRTRFAKIENDLVKKIKERYSLRKKSETLFEYLHDKVFKRYGSNTRFLQIFETGEYNCLTSATLYYILAKQHQIPIEIFVTQTHVYLQIDPQGEPFVLEMTDPEKGFDFVPNRQNYINFLLTYKLITRQDIDTHGEEEIYHRFVQQAHTTGELGLIAALFNNLAIENFREQNFPQALCFLRKARYFDPDMTIYRDRLRMILEAYIRQNVENFDSYLNEVAYGIVAVRDDSAMVDGLWQYINFALDRTVSQKKEYRRGLEMIEELRQTLTNHPYSLQRLKEVENIVFEHQAGGFYLRGDYDSAFSIAADLHRQRPQEERYSDLLANCGAQVAQELAEKGRTDDAYQLMDSLLTVLPDYPLVRDVYVNLIMASISADLQFGQHLDKVEKQLQKARTLDPDNLPVRNTLIGLYHTLAMRKVRQNELYAARRFATKGLRLDPGNQLLRQDLTLINDAILAEENTP